MVGRGRHDEPRDPRPLILKSQRQRAWRNFWKRVLRMAPLAIALGVLIGTVISNWIDVIDLESRIDAVEQVHIP